MGLSIVSEDGEVELWSSSYTGFALFRAMVGGLLGMRKYELYYEDCLGNLDARSKADADLTELFKSRPASRYFFEHSDCEGDWIPLECDCVLSLLLEVQSGVPDKWKDVTRNMIEGLRYCVNHGQKAIFC